LGEKAGSRVPAKSSFAAPGTVKVYEVWKNQSNRLVEVHYFEDLNGVPSDVKVIDTGLAAPK
jgi:hypothetical protein